MSPGPERPAERDVVSVWWRALWAGAMFGGGLLWAVAVAVGFTGASPGQLVWAASVLVAVSLPGVAVGQLRGRAEGDRTVVMSTIASVAGVVSILLFPFGGLLTLADLFDWPIYDNFIEAGRRLGQFLLGAWPARSHCEVACCERRVAPSCQPRVLRSDRSGQRRLLRCLPTAGHIACGALHDLARDGRGSLAGGMVNSRVTV
ncbi:MAG TPA: hypothetical protein VGB33_00115 [Acidimicrobiia bacterium]